MHAAVVRRVKRMTAGCAVLAVCDHATEAFYRVPPTLRTEADGTTRLPCYWHGEVDEGMLAELLEQRNPALAALQTLRRPSIIDLLLPIDVSVGGYALVRGSDESILFAREQATQLYQEACKQIIARRSFGVRHFGAHWHFGVSLLSAHYSSIDAGVSCLGRETNMLFMENILLMQVDHTFWPALERTEC